MGFSAKQLQALRRQPNRSCIRTREAHGRELTYLEGWYAISEANRIFGFDGWSRETIESKCVLARENRGTFLAVYIARVRVTVQADGATIIREGHGTGEGRGTSPGEVHDIALKAAETDATKRTLTTFGKPFGLELYRGGKDDAIISETPTLTASCSCAARISAWVSIRTIRPQSHGHPAITAEGKMPSPGLRARSRRAELESRPSPSASSIVPVAARPCARRKSIRASSPSPSQNGCATKPIWALLRHNLASSAADNRPIRIIFDLPNPGPLASKSATSSPSHFAAAIIGSFIRSEMRWRGGTISRSTRFKIAKELWEQTHPKSAAAVNAIVGPTSLLKLEGEPK